MSSASNYWQISPMVYGNATAISTSSTAAIAFAKGGGRYLMCAIGCNVIIQTGISTVGAAAATSGNFTIIIPSGQALDVSIPDSVTHFRAITDSGSGTLYWGKDGN